ncbi:MAG: alpha/beta hydrolase [Pseudomonadales bacterium]|nr:alpha/beta hydrolase [Pseudomonadales bacterium]
MKERLTLDRMNTPISKLATITSLIFLTACHDENEFWTENLDVPGLPQFYVETKLGDPAVLAWNRYNLEKEVGTILDFDIYPFVDGADLNSRSVTFTPELSATYTLNVEGTKGSLQDTSGEIIVLRDYCNGTNTEGEDYSVDLDLQLPDPIDFPNGNYPVTLFIHGGGWNSGDYSHFHQYLPEATARGYAAVSINYRLNNSDTVTWPSHIQDAKCAVRWLRANAIELDINPNAITAIGHSAGAHLAVMLSVTDQSVHTEQQTLIDSFKNVGDNSEFDDSVQAVVSIAGPHNLATHYFQNSNTNEMYNNFLGVSPVDENDLVYAQASPTYFIDPESATIPHLIIGSSEDNFVSSKQACELKLALETAGGSPTMLLYTEAEHQSYVELRGVAHLITGRNVIDTIANIFNFTDFHFKSGADPYTHYTVPIIDQPACEVILNAS